MAEVALFDKAGNQVGVAIVDDEDLPLVSSKRWYCEVGYAATSVHGRAIKMHRLILGDDIPVGMECDHINRDRLDNRRSNLRVCTHAENMQNRPTHRNGKSRFRGVYWASHANRWRAQARLDGKFYHIGYFADEEEAAQAASRWREQNMPFAVEAAA